MRRWLRWVAWGVAATALLSAAVLWWSPAAQDTLLRRFVARQMQPALAPPPASTALRVVFCGTGAPFPDRAAAKSCLAVFAGGRFFLIDSGPESTENLMLWRLPLAQLDAVLLTHFHSDHIGDLGELNMQSWVQGRSHPLRVAGPAGVEEVVAGFNAAYAPDRAARHAHHARNRGLLPLAAAPLEAQAITPADHGPLAGVASAVVFAADGLRITAFPVDHGVVRPALGYRFDYRGRSLVVSGDTRPTPAIVAAAQGTDLLVHEAQATHLMNLLAGTARTRGQPAIATLLEDTNEYHADPAAVARLANEANVRELVFTHFSPPASNALVRRAFFRNVPGVRRHHWQAARDGFWMDIPQQGSEFSTGQLRR